jgi:hypothetical protein
MNFHTLLKAVVVLLAGVSPLVANDIGPRMARSPEAQRSRNLKLIGATSLPPAELAVAKARILNALLDALQARVAASDARIREAPQDDPAAIRLKAIGTRCLNAKTRSTRC